MRLTQSTTKRWALFFIAYHLMTSLVNMTAEARRRVNFQPSYMSSDDIISYFKSFFAKASSQDRTNEQFYSPEDYSEDLYHKIDNLMPLEDYVKWLMKTKDITDKTNDRKISLLLKYAGFINSPCNPTSVFNQTLPKILKIWDGDKSIVSHELEQWQRRAMHVPLHQLCNRFRGLICSFRRALNPDSDHGLTVKSSGNTTCQCGGDPSIVGFFRAPVATHHQSFKEGLSYPDGCYIRPWKPCKHLSAVDNTFKGSYEQWHGGLENQRRILAQMVFPVARTHRCKQGTYCLDMVPGMKKPVCWCNSNSEDEECKLLMRKTNGSSGYVPPLGSELMNIRKGFARLIIPAGNTRRACNPEYNAQVKQLANQAGMDPSATGTLEIMRKLAFSGRTIRICDFREALLCDPKSKTCKGNLNCGSGKVHLGKGVCVSDNGYQCQSNEDCVQNAKCTYFKEVSDSACVCETGYGDECHLQHKPFFGGRFLPIISGFQDEKYIKLQIEMYKVLESWEDSMKLTIGDRCDPGLDKDSMEIVQYFGSLYRHDKERGATLLGKAHKVTRDGAGKLCRYSQFQRCDPMHGRCVPFVGKRIVPKTDSRGKQTLLAEIDGDMECSPRIPKIFQDMVTLMCKKGYTCEFKGAKKYCIPDCNSPFAPWEECSKLKGRAQQEETDYDDDLEESTVMTEEPEEVTTKRATTTTTVTPDPDDPDDDDKTTTTSKSVTDGTGPTPPSTSPPAPPPTDPPAPPPNENGFGIPCTSNEDCDAEKYLECSSARSHEHSSGTCVCIESLILSKDKSCRIELDELCDQDAIDHLKLLDHNYDTAPHCLAGDCTELNANKFCRPFNGDGSMFITKQQLDNLQGAMPSATECACGVDGLHDGSVYRTTMILTVSFTLWLFNNY